MQRERAQYQQRNPQAAGQLAATAASLFKTTASSAAKGIQEYQELHDYGLSQKVETANKTYYAGLDNRIASNPYHLIDQDGNLNEATVKQEKEAHAAAMKEAVGTGFWNQENSLKYDNAAKEQSQMLELDLEKRQITAVNRFAKDSMNANLELAMSQGDSQSVSTILTNGVKEGFLTPAEAKLTQYKFGQNQQRRSLAAQRAAGKSSDNLYNMALSLCGEQRNQDSEFTPQSSVLDAEDFMQEFKLDSLLAATPSAVFKPSGYELNVNASSNPVFSDLQAKGEESNNLSREDYETAAYTVAQSVAINPEYKNLSDSDLSKAIEGEINITGGANLYTQGDATAWASLKQGITQDVMLTRESNIQKSVEEMLAKPTVLDDNTISAKMWGWVSQQDNMRHAETPEHPAWDELDLTYWRYKDRFHQETRTNPENGIYDNDTRKAFMQWYYGEDFDKSTPFVVGSEGANSIAAEEHAAQREGLKRYYTKVAIDAAKKSVVQNGGKFDYGKAQIAVRQALTAPDTQSLFNKGVSPADFSTKLIMSYEAKREHVDNDNARAYRTAYDKAKGKLSTQDLKEKKVVEEREKKAAEQKKAETLKEKEELKKAEAKQAKEATALDRKENPWKYRTTQPVQWDKQNTQEVVMSVSPAVYEELITQLELEEGDGIKATFKGSTSNINIAVKPDTNAKTMRLSLPALKRIYGSNLSKEQLQKIINTHNANFQFFKV